MLNVNIGALHPRISFLVPSSIYNSPPHLIDVCFSPYLITRSQSRIEVESLPAHTADEGGNQGALKAAETPEEVEPAEVTSRRQASASRIGDEDTRESREKQREVIDSPELRKRV